MGLLNKKKAAATAAQSCSSTSSSSNNPLLSLSLAIREYFLVTLTSHPFVSTSVSNINTFLRWVNVPEKSLLTHEEFVLSSTAVVVTLLGYYVLFGKRHGRKRKELTKQLWAAQRQVSLYNIVYRFYTLQCLSKINLYNIDVISLNSFHLWFSFFLQLSYRFTS
jgi:hypothetical protein